MRTTVRTDLQPSHAVVVFTHHIDFVLFTDWQRKPEERLVRIEADRLFITARHERRGTGAAFTVSWSGNGYSTGGEHGGHTLFRGGATHLNVS